MVFASDESVCGFQLLTVDAVCRLAAIDGECEISCHQCSTVVDDLLREVLAVIGIEWVTGFAYLGAIGDCAGLREAEGSQHGGWLVLLYAVGRGWSTVDENEEGILSR